MAIRLFNLNATLEEEEIVNEGEEILIEEEEILIEEEEVLIEFIDEADLED